MPCCRGPFRIRQQRLIVMLFNHVKLSLFKSTWDVFIFIPWPFRFNGYYCWLCSSVCPSIHQFHFVRTRHRFELEWPCLHQTYIVEYSQHIENEVYWTFPPRPLFCFLTQNSRKFVLLERQLVTDLGWNNQIFTKCVSWVLKMGLIGLYFQGNFGHFDSEF